MIDEVCFVLRPVIACLLDTRLTKTVTLDAYPAYSSIQIPMDALSKSGGFVILYRKPTVARIVSATDRLATLDFVLPNKKPIRISFVYAPAHSTSSRNTFWQNAQLETDTDLWMGDFNVSLGRLSKFESKILNEHNMIHWIHRGDKNTHTGPDYTFEKSQSHIDHMFFSTRSHWFKGLINTIHAPFPKSDHLFIGLKLETSPPRSGDRPIIPIALRDDTWLNCELRGLFLRNIDDYDTIKKKISSLVKAATFKHNTRKALEKKERLDLILNAPPHDKTWHEEERQRLTADRLFRHALKEHTKTKHYFNPHKWISKPQADADRNIPLVIHNNQTFKDEKVTEAAASLYTSIFAKEDTDKAMLGQFSQLWNHHKTNPLLDFRNEITREETEHVLKNLKARKAPGPDNIPSWLYKDYAEEISHSLTRTFNNHLLDGSPLPDDFHDSITVLIPKSTCPDKQNLSSYRPISLMNTDAKVLAIIMARRLQTHLKDILSRRQYGFVCKRQIINPILNLDCALRNRLPEQSILLLDIEKAFDRVSHEAILKALSSAGVGNDVIWFFKQWISNNSTRMYINGKLSQPVPLLKGVRQGDPLSPLLFDIAIDLLFNRLEKELVGITPVKNGQCKIKFQVYADDTAIFCNDHNDISTALNILNDFEAATGTRVNKNKCALFATCPLTLQIAHGIPSVSNELERYLGAFFTIKGMVPRLSKKVDSICSSINQYTNPYIHARAYIVNSLLLSRLAFFVFLEDWKQSDMDKLTNACKNFIYKGSSKRNDNRKAERKAQDWKPTKIGGINFLEPAETSTISRAKIWNLAISSKNSEPWAEDFIQNHKYIPAAANCLKQWLLLAPKKSKPDKDLINWFELKLSLKEEKMKASPIKLNTENHDELKIWTNWRRLNTLRPVLRNFIYRWLIRHLRIGGKCACKELASFTHIFHPNCNNLHQLMLGCHIKTTSLTEDDMYEALATNKVNKVRTIASIWFANYQYFKEAMGWNDENLKRLMSVQEYQAIINRMDVVVTNPCIDTNNSQT